jgi:hypothetical protein
MGIFKKPSKPRISVSKDDNLAAMLITASHICDAFMMDKELTKTLSEKNWELIWSSLLFGAQRYMTTSESIKFTNDFIQYSQVNDKLKTIHNKVITKPDEKIFYKITDKQKEWLNAVNRQIYEIAYEEGLIKHTNVNRAYIYQQTLPMVEHYVTRNANPLTNTHLVFTQIVASSISLAAEEIISQEPRYGLQATKDRYGACEVVFSLAIFLFNQRI